MSHEEAGGLVLLAALVLLIGWVTVLRVRQPGILPRTYTAQPEGLLTEYVGELPEAPDTWTPETAMQTAGSPCSASGCPAMRYAPLDEHLISAHHAHDNRKPGTPT